MESKKEKPPKTKQSKQMQKKVDKYTLLMNEDQILGKGQYGTVYRALDQEKNQYAIKMMSMVNFRKNPFDEKLNKNYQQIKREIDVMKAAKHKNLVRLYEIHQSTNNLYLVIEFCNGGNLKEYLKKKKVLSQEEAIDLFKQLCEGYKVLNDSNIIHRDIKPENVMLHNMTPKLCDFGFGKVVENDVNEAQLQSYKCTPIYAPPQILVNQAYSSKCDIWSLGCVFYEMLFGYEKYPFMGKNQVQLVEDQKSVKDQPIKLPKNSLDPVVIDILQKMLRYNEEDRISWSELFQHPIMTKQFEEILDSENVEDDGDTLNTSIINNKKKLQSNPLVQECQVYQMKVKKSPGNNDQQQQQQKSDLEQIEDQIKNTEQISYISSKVDKLIYYSRNQALFASIIMQNFWGIKKQLQLDGYISHMIVYCLGGYYYYILNFLLNMLTQQTYSDFDGNLSKSDYDIYQKSSNIQETRKKITSDQKHAKDFFIEIEKGVLQEAKKTISNKDKKNIDSEQLQSFINFINQNSEDFKDYNKKLNEFLTPTLKQIDIKNINESKLLKALYSLIIFSQLEQHFPPQDYDKVDFKLFYEQKLNKPSSDELKSQILKYIQK